MSSLAELGERVSDNTWIFTLANGLRSEYSETRNGFNFSKPGFQTVLEVKTSILNEEIIFNNQPGNKSKNKHDEKTDTAFLANDHKDKTYHYCNKKGHIAPDCRRKVRDKAQDTTVSKGKRKQNSSSAKGRGKGKGKSSQPQHKGSYWCDHCQTTSHSTDYCRAHPYTEPPLSKGKGKGKNPASKGTAHGRGKGWSSGNFPSDCSGLFANVAPDSRSESHSPINLNGNHHGQRTLLILVSCCTITRMLHLQTISPFSMLIRISRIQIYTKFSFIGSQPMLHFLSQCELT